MVRDSRSEEERRERKLDLLGSWVGSISRREKFLREFLQKEKFLLK